MTAYLIANVDVRDPEGFDRYRAKSGDIIARHGGRFLVRGGNAQLLEDTKGIHRVVVVEFPDADAARAMYDSADYQAILPFRLKSAQTDIFIVAGVSD